MRYKKVEETGFTHFFRCLYLTDNSNDGENIEVTIFVLILKKCYTTEIVTKV